MLWLVHKFVGSVTIQHEDTVLSSIKPLPIEEVRSQDHLITTILTLVIAHCYTQHGVLSYSTHWGWVTNIWVNKLASIVWDNGLPPGRRQAIIYKQCWDIVNWTLGNKLQWNFNRNSYIFIQENAFENVACEMASICLGLNVLNEPCEGRNWNAAKTLLPPDFDSTWNTMSDICAPVWAGYQGVLWGTACK